MAHAPGWIELYGLLEEHKPLPPSLVAQCLANRNGHGETMLHWYAIEGSAEVLQQLVDLGFDVNAADCCGDVPIVSAASIDRWDNVRVLRRAGARVRGVTPCGYTYRLLVTRAGDAAPEDLRGDAYTLADLLDFDGPEDQPVCWIQLQHTQLTKSSFQMFCAERPEFAVKHECMMIEDAMDLHPEAGTLQATSPSALTRQLLHHIAATTGAAIDWDFEVPPMPDWPHRTPTADP
jgi:hypothetical protein